MHQLTQVPAELFGLRERGVLQVGWHADLVIFDLDSVKDSATFKNPHRFAEGFSDVIVNGEAVIRNGKLTEVRSGGPLRMPNH